MPLLFISSILAASSVESGAGKMATVELPTLIVKPALRKSVFYDKETVFIFI